MNRYMVYHSNIVEIGGEFNVSGSIQKVTSPLVSLNHDCDTLEEARLLYKMIKKDKSTISAAIQEYKHIEGQKVPLQFGIDGDGNMMVQQGRLINTYKTPLTAAMVISLNAVKEKPQFAQFFKSADDAWKILQVIGGQL